MKQIIHKVQLAYKFNTCCNGQKNKIEIPSKENSNTNHFLHQYTTRRMASSNQITRTAISLNMMGIKMLEKRCHTQAMETFHDAIRLLKNDVQMTSSPIQLENDDVSRMVRQQCTVVYDRALHRISRPEHDRKLPDLNMEVIRYQDLNRMNILNNMKLNNDTTLYIIQIQDVDFNEFNSCIMFPVLYYNLGISYIANSQSSIHRTNAASTKCLKSALKLFRLSYSICTKLPNSSTAISMNALQNSEQIQIMGIVIRGLIHTMNLMKEDETVTHSFCIKFEYLQSYVQDIVESMNTMFSTNNAAASAA